MLPLFSVPESVKEVVLKLPEGTEIRTVYLRHIASRIRKDSLVAFERGDVGNSSKQSF